MLKKCAIMHGRKSVNEPDANSQKMYHNARQKSVNEPETPFLHYFDQLFIVKNYWGGGGVSQPPSPPSRHAPGPMFGWLVADLGARMVPCLWWSGGGGSIVGMTLFYCSVYLVFVCSGGVDVRVCV